MRPGLIKCQLYMQVTGPKWATPLQIAHLTSSNNWPDEDVYLALHGFGSRTGCHWPRRPRALRWFDVCNRGEATLLRVLDRIAASWGRDSTADETWISCEAMRCDARYDAMDAMRPPRVPVLLLVGLAPAWSRRASSSIVRLLPHAKPNPVNHADADAGPS